MLVPVPPFKKTDDALWRRHLVAAGIPLPPAGGGIYRVNGTDVAFVPMSKSHAPHGLKAIVGKAVWVAIPKGSTITLQFVGPHTTTAAAMATVTPATAPVPAPVSPTPIAQSKATAMPSSTASAVSVPGQLSFVGIDVGGRPAKGFDLCRVDWSAGQLVNVDFAACQHAVPLPATQILRPLVADGNLLQLAQVTHNAATSGAARLWATIMKLSSAPAGVFIDSPSAFSRNLIGHGRRTEKLKISGVIPQSTPSICTLNQNAHGGDWGWLVYGMIAFAACRFRGGTFTLPEWQACLADGLYRSTRADALIIREVFPTATVEYLRSIARSTQVNGLLLPLVSVRPTEVKAVLDYLARGVGVVKKRGRTVFDRADSLVAALSSLPHARSDFWEVEQWPSTTKWQGPTVDAHVTEGAICVVT